MVEVSVWEARGSRGKRADFGVSEKGHCVPDEVCP